ncbi:TlpA family protein disulfide reductase [Chitinophaga solisilvae]|uniref:TlpA family protein disulfide reductase n=1 Tax=Chitinophaga solisilvae TaxID=1233460 RepID=UPI00136DB870|nr:TlpA disulfide reductase family protein [Chitinophaga solisilvae]
MKKMSMFCVFALLIFLPGVFTAVNAQTPVKEGFWRGVLYNRDGSEVPFNFEVTPDRVVLINGEERLPASRITRRQDSLIIAFDQFDNELALVLNSPEKATGLLRRQDELVTPTDTKGLPISVDRTGLPIKVTLEYGVHHRFQETGVAPVATIAGKWDVAFYTEDGREIKSVGIFSQEGSKVTGTFLKVTGDTRFLEGSLQGNSLQLSSFIGTGPNLITATVKDADNFNGYTSAPSGKFRFTAVRNEKAALPDAYTITHLKNGNRTFDLSLPDVDGKKISLKDRRFSGKPVIITITGTWCPNCMDEVAFLAPWYQENKHRGVEVLSVYYERKDDPAYFKKVLSRVKEQYNIGYPQLVGGLADKQLVAASLPSLDKFTAFPTTIFINKKGEVAKIHTGYNGPATGEYYQAFIREFNQEVNELLQEKGQ